MKKHQHRDVDTRLSSVMQTIHCNVGLKCFFQFYQNVYLLLSLCIHISLTFH